MLRRDGQPISSPDAPGGAAATARGDLRQRQHPPCPRRHRLPGRPSPPGAALGCPEPSLAHQYEEERTAYPKKSRLQSDQIKLIRARRPAFLAQFPTRRVGDQTAHAPERLSRCVIIAGCGYRAISAVLYLQSGGRLRGFGGTN